MNNKNCIELYINEALKEEQIRVPRLHYGYDDKGIFKYVTEIYEQPNQIGKMVLDFIQNDMKDNAYFIFQFYGFQTLLTEQERNEILVLNPNDIQELNIKLEKLYNKYSKDLESLKKQLIDIVEYCIFDDSDELKDLSPIERLMVFIHTKDIEEYPILKYNNFNKRIELNKTTSRMSKDELINLIKDKDNNRYGIQEIYEVDNFYKFVFLELYFILKEKTYLKKCKNCGKYFLSNNMAVVYCNNIFENGKRCREIGASKVFIKNLEKDEAYDLYRKVYKKKQALAKTKGGTFEIEYNLFKHQGKDKKNAYNLGEITKEEFMRWLEKA